MPVEWLLIAKGFGFLSKTLGPKFFSTFLPKAAIYAKSHGLLATASAVGGVLVTVGGVVWTVEKIQSLGEMKKALDRGQTVAAVVHAGRFIEVLDWREGVTSLGDLCRQLVDEGGRDYRTVKKLKDTVDEITKDLDDALFALKR